MRGCRTQQRVEFSSASTTLCDCRRRSGSTAAHLPRLSELWVTLVGPRPLRLARTAACDSLRVQHVRGAVNSTNTTLKDLDKGACSGCGAR